MSIAQTVAELRQVIDLTDTARVARDDAGLSDAIIRLHWLAGRIAEECACCPRLTPAQTVRTPGRPVVGVPVPVTWAEGNAYALRCAVERALPMAQGQRFRRLAQQTCESYSDMYQLAQRFVQLIP